MFILPLPLSPRPRPFGASSTNKVSRGKLSGRIKYLILFPRILSESKAVGSRPFIVIFTAFRCVFMDTSTPTVKSKTHSVSYIHLEYYRLPSLDTYFLHESHFFEDKNQHFGCMLENYLVRFLFSPHSISFKKLKIEIGKIGTQIKSGGTTNQIKNCDSTSQK